MRLLFEVTNTESHLAMYGPVIETLRSKHPDCEIRILALCEVQGLSTDRAKVPAVDRGFLQPYDTPFKARIRPKNIIGKAGNYADYLRILWEKRGVQGNVESILASLQPDAIILPNDRTTPHISIIRVAKKNKIPTLLIQEGIRKDDSYRIPKFRRVESLAIRRVLRVEVGGLVYHGQGGCDRIAAWGETSLQYFKRIGVPEEKVVLTGNPRIESVVKTNWGEKSEELRKRYSIPEGASVITFTANPVDDMGLLTPEQLSASVSMVAEAIAALENVHLFLKPHRSEDPNKYGKIISRIKANICLETAIELYPLLHMSDACLVFNSTVALEASALGIPVAMVNPFKVDMGVDFVENGLAVPIASREELLEFIRKCRSGEYTVSPQALKKYLAIVDGSAEKIASEIVKLASRGKA